MPDLLPINATPQERALARSVSIPIDVPIKRLWTPFDCPVGVLPFLANALSVDEWDPAWPEDTKRQAIAESVETHRRKGTPGAIKRALQKLGYEVELDEKTGVPYTFRLRRMIRAGDSAGGAVADEAMQRIKDVVNRTKNVRSELIGEGYASETDPTLTYVAAAVVSGTICEIRAGNPALPLDGFASGIKGSYWTVRMHGDYRGPIGRVKRNSDNAELDYYSIRELEDFILFSPTWQFLKLYSQAGGATTLNISGPASNGIIWNGKPALFCIEGDELTGAASVPSITINQGSMIMASWIDSGEATTQIKTELRGNFTLRGELNRTNSSPPLAFTGSWNNSYPVYVESPNQLSCVGMTFKDGTISGVDETADATDLYTETPVAVDSLKLTLTVANDASLDVPKITYGTAFWSVGMSVEMIRAACASVTSNL